MFDIKWQIFNGLGMTALIAGVYSFASIAIVGKLADNTLRQEAGEGFASHSCLAGLSVSLTTDPVNTEMESYRLTLLAIVFVSLMTWINLSKFITDNVENQNTDSMKVKALETSNLFAIMLATTVLGLMVFFTMNAIMSDYSRPWGGQKTESTFANLDYSFFGLSDDESYLLSGRTFSHADTRISGFPFYVAFASFVAVSVVLGALSRFRNIIEDGGSSNSRWVTDIGKWSYAFKYLFRISTIVLSIAILVQYDRIERIDYRSVPSSVVSSDVDNLIVVEGPHHAHFYSNSCRAVVDDYSVVVSAIHGMLYVVASVSILSLLMNMIPDIYRWNRSPDKVRKEKNIEVVQKANTYVTTADTLAAVLDCLFNLAAVVFSALIIYPFTFLHCPTHDMLESDNRLFVVYVVLFTLVIFMHKAFTMVEWWR